MVHLSMYFQRRTCPMNMSGHKSSYTQEKLRSLFQPVDMTTGEPWRKILLFMVPMLIGNIAQQLYNTVDSIVVGKYLGDHALAAVGSAGPGSQVHRL